MNCKLICIQDYMSGHLHPDDTFDLYEVKKGLIYDSEPINHDVTYNIDPVNVKIYHNGKYCGVHKLSLFKRIDEYRSEQIEKLEI